MRMYLCSDKFLELSRTSYVMSCRVESWFGSQFMGEIPVISGNHETDLTLNVPDTLTITVPLAADGVSYDPSDDPQHPLACWGQTLRVLVGIRMESGLVEFVQRGVFVVTDADVQPDEGTVTVTAMSPMVWVSEARLTAPIQPSGTFVSAMRQLLEPAVTVNALAAPTDRAIPSSQPVWDEDRVTALNQLLDSWPAQARMDGSGVLVVTAVSEDVTDPADTVYDLTSSSTTRVLDTSSGSVSRDGVVNCVVARGYDSAGTAVQGVAQDFSGGPLDVAGLFSPFLVPEFFVSPLLSSPTECVLAADTILARRRQQTARRKVLSAVPCLALQAGDAVLIDEGVGIIEQLRMPLTSDGGPMSVTVRVSGG